MTDVKIANVGADNQCASQDQDTRLSMEDVHVSQT